MAKTFLTAVSITLAGSLLADTRAEANLVDLDANGDQLITLDEARASEKVSELFIDLDIDKNGVIDSVELMALKTVASKRRSDIQPYCPRARNPL